MGQLADLPAVADVLPPNVQTQFRVPSGLLSATIFVSVIGAIIVAALFLMMQLADKRRRAPAAATPAGTKLGKYVVPEWISGRTPALLKATSKIPFGSALALASAALYRVSGQRSSGCLVTSRRESRTCTRIVSSTATSRA